MIKTFLVTGAAGFIGSQLALKLIKQGHKVVTVDNLSTGYVNTIPEGVIFIEGNCQDGAVFDRLKEFAFEAIFHIAGQSSGEVSFDNPVYDLQTNTQSTLLFLKYCLETGCKRFVYASTMSVYGDQEFLPVTEKSPNTPKSLYGVGKLASEHYLRIFAQFGIATAAVRLFNVYGPGQNLKNMRQGMVSIYIAQILASNAVHVKGSPERFRDFIFIDDVVNAFIAIEKYLKPSSFSLFNVCSGRKTTVGELVDFIQKGFGENISVKYEGSTTGDQFGIFGSNELLKSITGWKPEVSLEEGLKRMISWAQKSEL
jgi:UDP-glucose 4-epimerase